MAELLALRSCASPLVSSCTWRSSSSVDCRQRRATGLCWTKSVHSQRLSIRQKKNYRTARSGEKGCSAARAEIRDADGDNEPSSMSSASEEWQYFGKLFAACTAGAALIKYGSILEPSITQPNLVQALIMITTPALVSVAVLLAASSEQKSYK